MAELVYAPSWGGGAGNGVRVQVPLLAQFCSIVKSIILIILDKWDIFDALIAKKQTNYKLGKKYYESYIIIDGNLEDSAIDEVINKYENLFKKNEIEIKNIDKIGRRRLAYPIKKRVNGFYVCFEISSPSNLLTKLERTYILDESILRYLTIYMSSKTIKEKDEHLKNKAILQSKYEQAKSEAAQKTESVSEATEKKTELEVTNNQS